MWKKAFLSQNSEQDSLPACRPCWLEYEVEYEEHQEEAGKVAECQEDHVSLSHVSPSSLKFPIGGFFLKMERDWKGGERRMMIGGASFCIWHTSFNTVAYQVFSIGQIYYLGFLHSRISVKSVFCSQPRHQGLGQSFILTVLGFRYLDIQGCLYSFRSNFQGCNSGPLNDFVSAQKANQST